jgi:signal transduction histidine kinase
MNVREIRNLASDPKSADGEERELGIAREREAMREILLVISQSRDDEQPVFDVILENAARLCRAPLAFATMVNQQRTRLDFKAHKGDSFPGFVEFLRANPMPLDSCEAENARAVLECRTIQIEDLRNGELYQRGQPHRVTAIEEGGARTLLIVPLVSGGVGIGTLSLWREEVSPFSDDEVALVETFAAQAVIAIENVRQFRALEASNADLAGALERQTATSEVLDVISQSPSDAQPVFDVIAATAQRLCICDRVIIWRIEPDGFVLAATLPDTPEQRHMLTANPASMDERSLAGRAFAARRTLHVDNLQADPVLSQLPITRMSGNRTMAAVPLFSPTDEPAGLIMLARGEVQPFNAEEIALVETFADQAAIAIENVRQFKAVLEARDDAEAALADLKKAQERLIQAEKMASLGQLTAGIAHEIKNPLNFVNNFAKLSGELLAELSEILEEPIAALDEDEREDAQDLFRTVRENLDKINQHGRRADGIVKNMLLHSREGPSQRGTARVNSIAAEALNLAYHGARAENPSFNIEMRTDLAEEVGVIECYPQDLMRVFLNIISNGMYAAYQRGQEEEGFVPQIAVSSRLNGDRVEVAVRDNGNGIPPEAREKIFTPFFTTKPAGEGTGLGLSLSYDIMVKQHGGDLTVDSEPGQFTIFKVSLPQALPAEMGEA